MNLSSKHITRVVWLVCIVLGSVQQAVLAVEVVGEGDTENGDVYDYYAYPQLYASDNTDSSDYVRDGQAIDQDSSEIIGDDTDEFVISRNSPQNSNRHVTYVPNGAVISNVATESAIYDTDDDALIIENSDYEDKEWEAQESSQSNGNEFDTTLTGMMGALAEIQRKGDSMLSGIRRQREVLDKLERKADQAERRREQAEVIGRQLEEEKLELEAEVLELKGVKDTLMVEMQEDEVQMTRVKSGLAPLLSQVSDRKTELIKFESSIATKKNELQNFHTKIEEVTKNLSELKNSAVSVSVPSPITSSPVLLMALVVSIGFNLIAGAQAATTLFSEQRMDDLVTQFTASDEMAGLGSLAAAGLAGFFEEENINKRRRRKKVNNKNADKNIFKPSPSEEYYSYSDLPRQF